MGARILALLLLIAPAAVAARKPPAESASSAPPWLREAAARTVAGDLGGAAAVQLHDEWIVEPLAEGGVRATHRVAHRIATPDGLDDAGSTALAYRKDDRVERADAWNLLPDGTLRRPDPDEDVADLPWTRGGNAIDDVRLRTVEVPGVVVGSVVAFETIHVRAIDTGAFGTTFGDVDRPVGACRLELRVPAGWSPADHASRADAFARSADATSIAWSAPGLQPPPHEEWAPSDDERLPRIWIRWSSPDGQRGFRDWDGVARWYRELADPVLRDCGEAASLSARWKPADAAGFAESLRAAFAFASRDVRYVAIQLGIGGYRPQAPAFTCANRYGDCKAKSFLMRSVVEPWGWKAYPVLVLTRDAGRVEPAVPTPGQFNHCIVGLVLPEGAAPDAWTAVPVEGVGRVAFLDPTTESLGPWQLRPDDQGTTALLVLPDSGRLVQLPVQPPGESVEVVTLRATLDERGQVIAGQVAFRTTGTRAGTFRPWLAGLGAERARAVAQSQLQVVVPGARLVDHVTEGVTSLDGDVVETLRFQGGRLGQRAGDMIVIQPPALVLPIPAARLPPPPRTSVLDLGLPEERRVDVEVALPAGWEPETLPEPAAFETKDLSLRCAWERTADGFAVRGTGRQLVMTVSPEDYETFRTAAMRANGLESEGVVAIRTPVRPPG